ncbi:MAG TPA: RHS repeat-associated core domain-containing protein [Verrucomicrobiae bacterium]|nr:RHS repeat-associated core domain-containing protein [Verrucomicrobiae bacterium]
MKIIQILCLLGLTVTASLAQDDQPASYDDGWYLPTNAVTPWTEISGIHPLISNPTYPGGSSAMAEAISPDIAALARNLENDPTRIFNYVHDHIRYVHYFGSHKGAEMTLLERSGNDFDQCALLVALLRAAGCAPSYAFGMISIPYSVSNQQDYQHWVGAMLPNTNWNTTKQLAATINGNFGYPKTIYFTGNTNDVLFHHVWVQVTLNGTNYTLDPAYKVNQPIGGIGLDGAMQLNTTTLISSVSSGSTATADYVQNLNEANLRSTLGSYNSNLLSYIQSTCPNASVQQIVSGQSIVPSTGQPLGQSTPFTIQTQNGQWPVSTWTYIPTNLMAVLIVNLPGTNNFFYLPNLAGSRLSIICTASGVAQLWQEDTMVSSVQTTGTGATFTPTLGIQHPFGTNWDFTTPGFGPARYPGYDQSVSTQPYQRTNATYVLLYGLDANSAWLTKRQQQLDSYREQGYADSSREVTSETLNVMGLGWLVQTELAQELLAGQTATINHFDHRLGRMAQETGKGYYIDVYAQLIPIVSNNSIDASGSYAQNQAFQIGVYFGSAMEHAIIEQLQSSNLVAASTVKLLQLASANGQKIYLATSANWTAGANVSGNISNYTTSSLFTNFVNQGYYLLLPQNGSVQTAGSGSWAGSGFVAYQALADGAQVKMIIGGGYNGGFVSSRTATPNTPFIQSAAAYQSLYFNRQSATSSFITPTGADPVNMVDGSFLISAADLSLGGVEPRGLNLTRYYSSARRNSNVAGMAPGWLHNYYCLAVPTSAALASLGGTTPQQMAPMIVALRAAANIYDSSQPTPKGWMTTALIAKWGLDQLINNAVSVNLGNATIQFVKQPDGSYTPPANCTMTLIKTNGAYWLSERHGRTFKFSTNSLLASITDQYGQSLNLTYTNNNVKTVSDWKGRTLTFSYTSGQLTSVSDGTRSVSYEYTSGDLTSFTDAEGKTSTYAYDANHQITATFDALSRLVITNSYDAYGHITTQLTQGNTNSTWQVFASGYDTVEVDPAGDQRQFSYDDKSRETSFQDALGNVTQMVYDGQDHVVLTISPLNETNRTIYDGNNNLIASVDPLGFTNQFIYDSQNNLTRSIDARGNPTTYGYNAQFSLIGQTNGAGDFVNYNFNSDGTLHTRADAEGTTIYDTYDSYGQLTHITYPGSLGGESFVNSSVGDPTSHTDANANVTSFQYNARRQLTNSIAPTNLTAKVSFDAVGNLASTTDARGNVTSNRWSATRHLLATVFPVTPQGVPVITNAYDNRDWLTRTVDPLQNPTLFSNDVAGRLISVTDPVQRTTTFGYDADGHKLAATNAAQEVTSQTWDARGSLLKLTDGAGHFSTHAYDAAGNQIILTNRNGKKWQFQFDGANRLTNIITPLTRSTSLTFDQRGLLKTLREPSGQMATNFYDAKGRLTNRVDGVASTLYGYDANDNVTSITNVGQAGSLLQTFDAYNRVSSFKDVYGNLIQYKYDANGNLTNLVYPGGKNIYYAYDSLNRMTNVTDWSQRQTTINYDLASRITGITRPNGSYRTIGYDAAGQATNIMEQMSNSLPIAIFRLNWDAAARPQWEFAAPLPHTTTIPTRNMTYDDDNRLATVNGSSVTNDLDGNLTGAPLTNGTFASYTYDTRNRLLNAGGVTNAYDAAGNRVGLVQGTNATVLLVNPNAKLPQVLMRIRNGVTNYYIYGAGLLYQITETATATNTLTYHYDYRGSTIALSADSGLVTDRIEYSAYGLMTYRTGTSDTPFLFNGRYGVQTDPNGLLFMRARYYNPFLCRFISADPSGFGGGLNCYAYANGNPVSLIDPFGLNAASTGDSFFSWLDPSLNIPAANQRMIDFYGSQNTDTFMNALDYLGDLYTAFNPPPSPGMKIGIVPFLPAGGGFGAIEEIPGLTAAEGTTLREGSFSIVDWSDYPANVPKPTGSFNLLEGAEYDAARTEANAANRAMHQADPSLNGLQLHEIQPVKFGGSPTDPLNKIPLTPQQHAPVTTWWNQLQRDITQ